MKAEQIRDYREKSVCVILDSAHVFTVLPEPHRLLCVVLAALLLSWSQN